MIQIFVILFSIFAIGYSTAFAQQPRLQKETTSVRWKYNHPENMTREEKKEYAKSLLQQRGLAKQGMPNIEISERQPEGGVYSEYNSPDESPSYHEPTIVLFPAAFASEGKLEVALRHEMMHFLFDQNGPAAGLKNLWVNLKEKISEKFDFSSIPQSLKDEVIKGLLKAAMRAAEELFIAEEVVKIAASLKDAENAIAAAKETQQIYQEENESFYNHSETFIGADGQEYKIRPKNQADENGSNIAGEYYCMDGDGCDILRSGTRTEGDLTITTTIQPLTIQQIGAQIILTHSSTQEIVSRREPRFANSVDSVLEGRGEITGDRIVIEWNVVTESKAWDARFDNRQSQSGQSVVKILSSGDLQFSTTSSGRTITQIYRRR